MHFVALIRETMHHYHRYSPVEHEGTVCENEKVWDNNMNFCLICKPSQAYVLAKLFMILDFFGSFKLVISFVNICSC